MYGNPGDEFVAIEIDSTQTWDMICALQPNCKELDPVANGGNFMVISPGELEGAILPPTAVAKHFDHITPNPRKVKFVTIVR